MGPKATQKNAEGGFEGGAALRGLPVVVVRAAPGTGVGKGDFGCSPVGEGGRQYWRGPKRCF